jgi:hypothetical protein
LRADLTLAEGRKTFRVDALAIPDIQNSDLWVGAELALRIHLLMLSHPWKTLLAVGLVTVDWEMALLGDYFGDLAETQHDTLGSSSLVENMVEAEANFARFLRRLALLPLE